MLSVMLYIQIRSFIYECRMVPYASLLGSLDIVRFLFLALFDLELLCWCMIDHEFHYTSSGNDSVQVAVNTVCRGVYRSLLKEFLLKAPTLMVNKCLSIFARYITFSLIFYYNYWHPSSHIMRYRSSFQAIMKLFKPPTL